MKSFHLADPSRLECNRKEPWLCENQTQLKTSYANVQIVSIYFGLWKVVSIGVRKNNRCVETAASLPFLFRFAFWHLVRRLTVRFCRGFRGFLCHSAVHQPSATEKQTHQPAEVAEKPVVHPRLKFHPFSPTTVSAVAFSNPQNQSGVWQRGRIQPIAKTVEANCGQEHQRNKTTEEKHEGNKTTRKTACLASSKCPEDSATDTLKKHVLTKNMGLCSRAHSLQALAS